MKLTERDQKHLWHPLTHYNNHSSALGIVRAKGVYLYDEDGNRYIDAIASWYTAMYGHCHSYITKKVASQMRALDQVVFAGFTHEPAIQLSENLIKILPPNQQKLFFSDNGSTAVEVALKMAFQYHLNRGEKRNTLIAFEEGFHGDTFGAMSVSGLSVYNHPFEDFFLHVIRIPTPKGYNNREVLAKLYQIIDKNRVAAFIYEPLVQGAAGMKMYDAQGLQQLLVACQKQGVLTIADEVMTGFGKTGRYFASDYLESKPDLMCLSKALTAGLLPMAITSCTQTIFDAFCDEDVSKSFFHAHTYTANPLACAAALAGIELLQSKAISENLKNIIQQHQAFQASIQKHPAVTSVRQLGVILAIDLHIETERYGKFRNQLFTYFMSKGIFLRPLGNTLYIVPPFISSRKHLQKIYNAIETILEKIYNFEP